ncbi:MAG TPA: hypothetical protein VLC46_01005 [Thermoanaerobaculia bacterium]|nr:hypothetical protein [Thermoanaerobaculia bacterium]
MSAKTATITLLCAAIIGCAKGSHPTQPPSAASAGLSREQLLRKASPSLSPPAPADGPSDVATENPFGEEPEPSGKRYEYLVDTLYVWSPAQVKEAASSAAPEVSRFVFSRRNEVMRLRASQGWQYVRQVIVPKAASVPENPFINAPRLMVIYRRMRASPVSPAPWTPHK